MTYPDLLTFTFTAVSLACVVAPVLVGRAADKRRWAREARDSVRVSATKGGG
jgi:hypothetical protein